MKNRRVLRTLALVVGITLLSLHLQAQAPAAIPYQAVARNGSGNLLQSQSIALRFSIHDGTAGGTVVYQETQTVTTNALGLFSVNIGQGTVVSGSFSSINWGGGSKFAQVEMDPAGGTAYVDMGTTQMLSVPFALYATSSGGAVETDPQVSATTTGRVPRWTGTTLNDGSLFDDGAKVGLGTASPAYQLHVKGTANTALRLESSATTGTWLSLQNTSNNGRTWNLISSGQNNGEGSGKLLFNDASTSTRMTIDGSGNVGIGTSSPAAKLDVSGTARTASLQMTAGAANGYLLQSDANGNASWADPASLFMETDPQVGATIPGRVPRWTGTILDDGTIFDDGVNVGIGTSSPIQKLDVDGGTRTTYLQMTNGATDGYVLQGDAEGRAYWVNPTQFSEVSSSTAGRVPRWTGTTLDDGTIFDDGLKVGIGTSSPVQRLDVDGGTRTTYLQMTNGAANGYVLQSDANGNGSWVNPTYLPAGTSSKIQDADADTKIETEHSPDEDAIHLSVGGTDYYKIRQGKIEVNNTGDALYLGTGAGNADNLSGTTYNIGVGAHALENILSTACCNTAVGVEAMQSAGFALSNSAFGHRALQLAKGHSNTAVGTLAGMGFGEYTGEYNTFLGGNAGAQAVGSRNVFVGFGAGLANHGSDNVFLGYEAGRSETGNNKLYIDNTNTGSPLIWGDFANNYLNFNANVGIGTSSPSQKLDVIGTTRTTNFQMTGGANNGYLLQSDAGGNASWADPSSLFTDTDDQTLSISGSTLSIDGGNSVNLSTAFSETDPQVSVTVPGRVPRWTGTTLSDGALYDDGANLGIGTTSPGAKLDIKTNSIGRINLESSADHAYLRLGSPNNSFFSSEAAIECMSTLGGNAKLRWLFGKGSGKEDGGNTGADFFINRYNDAGNYLGQPLVIRRSTGYVSIGHADPQAQLDVSGTTKTTNLQMTSGATNGYVLQGDAGGNASWVNPSSLFADTDDQTLSLSGSTLSIDGGNSVNLSTAFSETDPQVSSSTTGRVPRWTGTTLSDGSIFDSGANVGIGTTAPTYSLQVTGSGDKMLKLESTAFSGTRLSLQNISNIDNTWNLISTGPASSEGNGKLLFNDDADGTRMLIDGSGNVGIGTTNPTQKLEVNGTTKTTNLQMTSGATSGYLLQSDASGNGSWVNPTALGIVETDPQVSASTTGRVPRWTGTTLSDGSLFDDGTNVGIGTTSPTYALQVKGSTDKVLKLESAVPGGTRLSLRNNSLDDHTWSLISTGYASGEGARKLAFNDESGGTRMVIDDSGRVGIGTTNPAQKLEVNGTTKTTNLQMTSGATSGYLLQSDANGNGSWVDPTALGIVETDPQVSSSTTGRVPRWTGTTLSDGSLFDDGTNIGVGTSLPAAYVDITGNNTGSNSLLLRSGNSSGSSSSNQITFGFNGTSNYRHAIKTRHNPISDNGNAIDFYTWDQGVDANASVGTKHIMTLSGNGNGKVGIGTTAPVNKLDVEGSVAIGSTYSGSSDAPTDGAIIQGQVGIGTSTPASKLDIEGGIAIGSAYSGSTAAPTDGAIIQGQVGIGTLTPASKLDIEGGIAIGSAYSGSTAAPTDGAIIQGNVGIGTPSPASLLDMEASGTAIASVQSGVSEAHFTALAPSGQEASLRLSSHVSGTEKNRWAFGKSNDTESGSNAGSDFFINRYNDAGTFLGQDFRIQRSTGNVGIGTSTPTQAKLVVNGSTFYDIGEFGFFNSLGGTGVADDGAHAYSIYASNRIAAQEFNAHSDARIKNVKGQSDSRADLHTLMGIKITDYTLKDTIAKGNRAYKKVIAQQVEEVYPQAVNKLTDVVPDIYRLVDMHHGHIALANTLKAGDRVKLVFGSRSEMARVVAADAAGFEVDLRAEGRVFVYGREVSDFRTVDYEALSTLNISATQELLKMIERQQAVIEALQADNAALKADSAALKAANAGMQSDIQMIKSALQLHAAAPATAGQK